MRINGHYALLVATSTFAWAHPVLAQSGQGSAEVAEQSAAAEQAEVAGDGEIVVTGSRTITDGTNSPVPLTVVSADTLQDVRPTSLTESIQVFPVFSGSRGQTSNASATGGVGAGNGTAAQLNLRNIGPNRNLVLLDGRRVPPTSITNIVDADVIPQLLVERVDIVTGGVSAVYGSDAVTGVVNFVLDKDFTGIKGQAYAGISEEGDGSMVDIGLAWGTSLFDGRGHFEASYEYRDDPGVSTKSSREWFNRPVVIGNGTTIPYELVTSATLSNNPFGGRIINCGTNCGIAGQYFAENGVLSPFVNGTTYPGTATQSGGAGGYQDHVLRASQRMHQGFARFDYELADGVDFFAMGSINDKKNALPADYLTLSNITLRSDNAFLAPEYQAQIPGETFTYGQVFTQADRLTPVPKTRQYMGSAGLSGGLGSFDWNVAYIYGEAELKTTLLNNVNQQRLAAALDVVTGANGEPVCYASTVGNSYADCVPLNLFGPSAASAAAVDYISDDTTYRAVTRQHDIVADIAGELFAGWAGPIRGALSGEWRRQTFESESNAEPTQYADCTDLRYNCRATGSRTILYNNTFPSSGLISQNVWEAAAEINVPLLQGLPMVESLTVNGAARFTSYETVGDYWTWKVGVDWKVFDDLRVRGTVSRDIRAPTLSDLFAPTSVVVGSYTDLLTNTTALTPGINESNTELTAEIGHTWTVGFVYRPSYAPGVSLSVDYYDLRIDDAITTVQGFANSTQNGCNIDNVQLYCDLIVRNDAGAVTNYIIRPVNLSEISTYGVDAELSYSGTLFGRPASFRALGVWQPHIYYRQPSTPTLDQGGVAFGAAGLTASPEWRATATASVSPLEDFRVDLLYRWRSSLAVSAVEANFAPGDDRIDANGNLSLNFAVQVEDDRLGQAEFFFNIQNLLDTDPPIANATGSANSPGAFNGYVILDDPIGRYFTSGVRVRF